MATEGGLREGWANPYGTRYNNTFFRGSASVTGSLVVTLPLPIRFCNYVQAEILASTAPNAGHIVTVGSISNNTFTLYVWQVTSSSVNTLIASTTATTVMWQAWGSVSGGTNLATGSY